MKNQKDKYKNTELRIGQPTKLMKHF